MSNQKQKSKNIRILIFLVAFCVFLGASGANADGNVTGWIWGGTDGDGVPNSGDESGLGWFSMNSLNCDTDANGTADNPPAMAGCPSGTAMVQYGVSIPAGDGDLSGEAWSENLGWVDFDNSQGYLTSCPFNEGVHGCNAYREGNFIKGWARIESLANANGSGWIHLYDSANSGANYGVEISKMDGTGANHTYAWSDEHGSIDFSRALGVPPAPPTVTFLLDSSPADKTISVDTPFSWPQTITLSWTSTNTTSCMASSSDNTLWGGSIPHGVGPQNLAGDVLSLTASNHISTFTLHCNGSGGEIEEQITVTTGCHIKECNIGNGTCGLGGWDPLAYGVANNAQCITDSTCSTDADCQPRVGSGWREVAP